jgi:glycine betaine/proline transport system permease protein/glycine betaine/proline transport system substrate-binding protein
MSGKLGRAVLYARAAVFLLNNRALGLMNETITIVITSVIISLIIGFPIGVLISASPKSNSIVRPILDTCRQYAQLCLPVPAVMLLGLGNVPAVIATTIYAVAARNKA